MGVDELISDDLSLAAIIGLGIGSLATAAVTAMPGGIETLNNHKYLAPIMLLSPAAAAVISYSALCAIGGFIKNGPENLRCLYGQLEQNAYSAYNAFGRTGILV